jgi:plastocyanin
MTRKLFAAVLTLACAAAMAAPALAGTKTVTVKDFAFGPKRLTIRHGTTVVWKWDRNNFAGHNVTTKKVPHGAKQFHSLLRVSSYTYKKRFTVKGTYLLHCTIHDEMQERITVR